MDDVDYIMENLISPLTTEVGRKNCKIALDVMKEHGYTIIYGDTDSIHFKPPDSVVETDKKLTKEECQTKINRDINNHINNIQEIINNKINKYEE